MQVLPPALPAALLGSPAVPCRAVPCLPCWYGEVRGQDPGDMWQPMGIGLFRGKSEVIWDTLPAVTCLQACKGLAAGVSAKANLCHCSPPAPSRFAGTLLIPASKAIVVLSGFGVTM